MWPCRAYMCGYVWVRLTCIVDSIVGYFSATVTRQKCESMLLRRKLILYTSNVCVRCPLSTRCVADVYISEWMKQCRRYPWLATAATVSNISIHLRWISRGDGLSSVRRRNTLKMNQNTINRLVYYPLLNYSLHFNFRFMRFHSNRRDFIHSNDFFLLLSDISLYIYICVFSRWFPHLFRSLFYASRHKQLWCMTPSSYWSKHLINYYGKNQINFAATRCVEAPFNRRRRLRLP